MADEILGLLSELERRFDGPVPALQRRIALAGGPSRLTELEARARGAVFDPIVRAGVAQAAAHRRAGRVTTAEATRAKLRLYRSAGLAWLGQSGA